MGLATDAAGNLYYGNGTFGPLKIDLFKRTPVGTVSSLGTVSNASAGFVSFPAFDLGYDTGQRIYLDWETPLDRVWVGGRFLTKPLPGTEPVLTNITETERDQTVANLRKLLQQSRLALPIVDSRLSPSPFAAPADAVHVRFGANVPNDETLGHYYEKAGIDKCNKIKYDRVAIFGAPSGVYKRKFGSLYHLDVFALTIAHEIGHALGLVHVFDQAGFGIMDYIDLDVRVESYLDSPTNKTERPDFTGTVYSDTQNPLYHIRMYTLDEKDPIYKKNEKLKPGTIDLDCKSATSSSRKAKLYLTNVILSESLTSLAVHEQLTQTPIDPSSGTFIENPNWRYLDSVGAVSSADLEGKTFAVGDATAIQISGSTLPSHDTNIYVGFGDVSNPVTVFNPSDISTLGPGKIFKVEGVGLTVIGTYSANILPPGDLTNDNVVNMSDFQEFIGSFSQCGGTAAYNPEADYDNDGCVTFVDFQIWYSHYLNYMSNP